ncbi:hypothetical protein P171DRAFT_363143 [Karstenula rhodostoma CBS 690.94]|uniref:Uncharacterized protein n=1 Tax=Karstenula rhodostoma CBS 690.94 TaxID=1392251 RepID=A0A9P4UB37_9PLEO|nr:hypothetical protein P171DRAFT_363143 [Karstenula rhodostoma CBS 690.94]
MLDAPPVRPVRARPASHSSIAPVALDKLPDTTFSLLLSLPRELRDKVYTFALVSQFPFWWPSPTTPKHNVALGLLSVSRQVHKEAAPIVYAQNKFLFTNPSDCTMFRVVASPCAENITSVYFRIREKDVKLWATYLGSKDPSRSMKHDLPRLKSLWIFLRCGMMGTPGVINNMVGNGGLPAPLAAQTQAIHQALGTQLPPQVQVNMQVLQQAMHQAHAGAYGNMAANAQAPMPFVQFAQNALQNQHQNQNQNTAAPHPHGLQNNPPANPSPLATIAAQQQSQPAQNPPHGQHHHRAYAHGHGHHQHGFFTSFMRWEREMGLENLCLSLQETRPVCTDVKIVCIVKLPRPELQRLVRVYADELNLDKNGDARTRFRRVHGVDVSLEVSGYEIGA